MNFVVAALLTAFAVLLVVRKQVLNKRGVQVSTWENILTVVLFAGALIACALQIVM
ncbi:hypothetical protein GCM10027570_00860 [Streptomonospora sediminis]